MPGLNQKGPMGQGPMTGRKMGRCTNYGKALKKDTDVTAEKPEEIQTGGDFGQGFGRRGRGGCGRGQRNRFRGGW